MIFHILQGATFALMATLMPGPFQAFLLSQTLKNGWKRTLPAAFAPLVTDGAIIALFVFLLTHAPPWFLDALRVAGGLFILYLARGVLRVLRSDLSTAQPTDDAARQTLFSAVAVNMLNPNPYIFWSVVGCPILLSAWRESVRLGMAFLAGFFGTFVCGLSLLIIVFATAGKLNPKANQILLGATGFGLLAFGIYQIAVGLMAVAH